MRDLEVAGDGLKPGTTYSFRVVSPLPYRMRLKVSVLGAGERSVEASVDGDLVGTGTIELVDQDRGSVAELGWSVTITHPQMRLATRFARPLLRWGQTWAIQSALKGFLRQVTSE